MGMRFKRGRYQPQKISDQQMNDEIAEMERKATEHTRMREGQARAQEKRERGEGFTVDDALDDSEVTMARRDRNGRYVTIGERQEGPGWETSYGQSGMPPSEYGRHESREHAKASLGDEDRNAFDWVAVGSEEDDE